MIQFDYPSGGIGKKERKRYTFANFRGVDTSVAEINVSPTRAVASTNFVDRNGVLHKRYGWEQIYQFDEEINGFWVITIKGVESKICYAGTKFFILKETGWQQLYTNDKLASRQTECYVQGDKAYFVGCGDLLVFNGSNMSRVYDYPETYIPTTTAQILPENLVEDGLHGQYVRDNINLLTGWRKNTLVGRAVPEGGELIYRLDAASSKNVTVSVEGKDYTLKDMGEAEIIPTEGSILPDIRAISVRFTPRTMSPDDVDCPEINFADVAVPETYGKWILLLQGTGGNAGLRWYREADIVATSADSTATITYRVYTLHLVTAISSYVKHRVFRKYFKDDGEDTVVSEAALTEGGYTLNREITPLDSEEFTEYIYNWGLTIWSDVTIKNLDINYRSVCKFFGRALSLSTNDFEASFDAFGALKITKWKITQDSKTANVEVKLYVANQDEGLVSSCKFSTLYGVDGGADRLFLANGDSEEHRNKIFFSEMHDFTYFPDNFTKVIGTTANEIKGFIRLANGSMAALKSLSINEPTVYVFNGEYMSGYYDSYESEPYLLPKFSTSGVSTTQGIIASYACGNLADDSLFLSQNGVYALELSQGTDSQRFAKERSLPINNLLLSCNYEDLQNACAITHRNKYYLAIKHYKQTTDTVVVSGKTYYERQNGVYIAISPDDDLGMSRYYEREDCVYVADAHYTFLPAGAMSDAPSYEWYPLTNIPVRKWFLLNGELWFGTDDGRICRFIENQYYDEKKLFLATEVSSFAVKKLTQAIPHAITLSDNNSNGRIDTFSMRESLDIQEGDVVTFISGDVEGVIYPDSEYEETISLIHVPLYVTFVGAFKGEFNVKLNKDDLAHIEFTKAQNLVATISKREVIKAERTLPTFDFGMPDYLKTLESFTVTMNGVNGGYALLDIYTRNNQMYARNIKGQSHFNALSGLNKSSFNVPFQNSYTQRVLVRNFNYIILKFYNEEPIDCSVSSISLLYKYNRASGGIK